MTKDLAKLRRAALSPDAVVVTSKPPTPPGIDNQSTQNMDTATDVKGLQLSSDCGGDKLQLISTRSVGFPTGLQHYYIPLCLSDKFLLLDWLLDQGESLANLLQAPISDAKVPDFHQSVGDAVQRVIVFCKRCQETRLVTGFLRERGHLAIGLTGRMKQPERKEALREFLYGRVSVLVATDVASRGLDVPNVALVVNYSVPLSDKTYRHRVGRAARAGQPGVAVTLVTRDMAADFIDLETKLLPHLASPTATMPVANPKTGMSRWPIPLPGKKAMLMRSRVVDEARARAGKAIRNEDLERRRMQETDSDSDSLADQSVNLSSSLDDPQEYTGEAKQGDDSDDSSTSIREEATDTQLFVTSGLAGIRAARDQLRKTSREKAERRRQRAKANDESRSAAAEGWGLRYTLKSIESAMLDEKVDGSDQEEHLRFEEPLKAKYMKVTQRKRHVRQ